MDDDRRPGSLEDRHALRQSRVRRIGLLVAAALVAALLGPFFAGYLGA